MSPSFALSGQTNGCFLLLMFLVQVFSKFCLNKIDNELK